MLALVQIPASPPDTIILAAPPTFLSTAEAASTILLTLVVLGVLIAIINGLIQLRRLTQSVTDLMERLEKDAGPLMDRAKSVGENLDFITTAVRTDVQKLQGSVSRLNDRLMEASERMEERIQDFSALVEVLQSEAEELALDTAAAVRGVKAGTRSLAERGDRPVEGQGNGELPLLGADEEF
jgi:methyl-accepting chemotaxis protein